MFLSWCIAVAIIMYLGSMFMNLFGINHLFKEKFYTTHQKIFLAHLSLVEMALLSVQGFVSYHFVDKPVLTVWCVLQLRLLHALNCILIFMDTFALDFTADKYRLALDKYKSLFLIASIWLLSIGTNIIFTPVVVYTLGIAIVLLFILLGHFLKGNMCAPIEVKEVKNRYSKRLYGVPFYVFMTAMCLFFVPTYLHLMNAQDNIYSVITDFLILTVVFFIHPAIYVFMDRENADTSYIPPTATNKI